MATTGAKLPGSGASVSEAPWSDNAWTTPGNITAADASTANITAATYDAGDQSTVLKAQGFDFSAIPDTATIDGVIAVVNAWYRSGTGAASGDLAQLLDATGAKVGTNKWATNQPLNTTSATTYTLGTGADLWGNTLTPAIVKNANFGIALGFLATAANSDIDVDYITLEVFYTVPAVTHATSGALAGQGATTAGTAAHKALHASSGALAGAGGTVSGTASRTRVHTTSATLAGQGGNVTGAASRTRQHASVGALAGQGATVAASAARTRQHASTGALAATGAALSGTASRASGVVVHATTGVLQGQGATVAGSATRTGTTVSHTTTGTLQGQGATVAGSAARTRQHATSGTLAATGAALEGAALRTGTPVAHATSGTLQGLGAVMVGAAMVGLPVVDDITAPQGGGGMRTRRRVKTSPIWIAPPVAAPSDEEEALHLIGLI